MLYLSHILEQFCYKSSFAPKHFTIFHSIPNHRKGNESDTSDNQTFAAKKNRFLRALDKRGYLMIIEGYFFLFPIETICFVETFQMMSHNICFMQN